MLNLVQHLTKSRTYETLKQVQGDKSGLFTRPSNMKPTNVGPIVPPKVAPNRIKPKMAPKALRPKSPTVINGKTDAKPPHETQTKS